MATFMFNAFVFVAVPTLIFCVGVLLIVVVVGSTGRG